jgi:UMF1 family MFS transporter
MYDWANSAYSLVITTAIFPLYYESAMPEKIVFWGMSFVSTALINYTGALGFLLVSAMLPLLSGIADYTNNKRRFLTFFCALGSTSCAALWFFNPDEPGAGLLFYLLALIGFWSSLVFYNAYLPEIAPPEMHNKLSARGFSMGYLGSSILLLLCLGVYFIDPGSIKLSFVLTGIWWFGFALLSLRNFPASSDKRRLESHLISKGYRELRQVWQELKTALHLKRFLQAFFIYSMGVQTVMLVAVYFGTKEISWSSDSEKQTGLIISILAIQLIAIPGAHFSAWVSKQYGNIRSLMLSNVLWMSVCIVALVISSPLHFYLTAGVVGFIMGGIQSASRATYARLLPETRDTASYFSFYEVAEKIGIVIGLFIFAILEEAGNMRISVVSLIVFFAMGIILLLRIPSKKSIETIRTSAP